MKNFFKHLFGFPTNENTITADDITVCIPTFHSPASLNATLTSLAFCTDEFSELVIGVTGKEEDSLDGTSYQIIEMLREEIKVYIESGFTGLLQAKCFFHENSLDKILLILDHDAIVDPGYFNLAQHFSDPKVGAVSGSLQTPINPGYRAWSKEPFDIGFEGNLPANQFIYSDEKKEISLHGKYQCFRFEKNFVKDDCQCLIGTAMFIRAALLQPDMFYQKGVCCGEELDYTYNIYKQGYKLIFDSSEVAWHLHSNIGGARSKRLLTSPRIQETVSYFVKKWGFGNYVKTGLPLFDKELV